MTNDVKISDAAVVAPLKKRKRKKIASLDRRKARAGWIFVLPFLIGFVLIYLPMVVQSLNISFSEMVTEGDQIVYKFNGFTNYQEALFVDLKYIPTLLSGLANLAFELPAILIFSLFMAVMLNQKMAGRAVFRSIFFIPVILCSGIMDGWSNNELSDKMESGSIDDGSGQNATDDLVSAMDLQMLFSSMKVGGELVIYVTQMVNNIYNIVNRCGVQLLIFLAALQSISPAIYESCKIDGATGWETFWKITFPMISPMILVNAVYTIIDSFTSSSNPVMEYVLSPEVYDQHLTRSTAMAWIYFLIVILVVALIALVMSAFVFYQRKND
ncbi:MAG: sugar ABC transporter permease [Clostridia bacterium]|nr:sugar ABC transporter permease [Clostridia bacterium]